MLTEQSANELLAHIQNTELEDLIDQVYSPEGKWLVYFQPSIPPQINEGNLEIFVASLHTNEHSELDIEKVVHKISEILKEATGVKGKHFYDYKNANQFHESYRDSQRSLKVRAEAIQTINPILKAKVSEDIKNKLNPKK